MKHPIGRSLVFLAFVCLVWQTGDLFAQNQAVSSVNISDALTHSDEEFDVLLKSFPREKLPGVWKSLDVAGRKAYFDGDYRKADQFHQKARLVALSLSDMLRFGKSSHQLGLAFVRQNKRNEAISAYLDARIKLKKDKSRDAKIAWALVVNDFAILNFSAKRPDKSFRGAWRARLTGVDNKNERLIAVSNIALASFYRQTGKPILAIAFLEEARSILSSADHKNLFDVAYWLARIYRDLGELKISSKEQDNLTAHSERYPEKYRRMLYWQARARYAYRTGQKRERIKYLKRYSNAAEKLQVESGIVRAKLALIGATLTTGNWTNGVRDLEKLLFRTKNKYNRALVLMTLGSFHARLRNKQESARFYKKAHSIIYPRYSRLAGITYNYNISYGRSAFKLGQYREAYEAISKVTKIAEKTTDVVNLPYYQAFQSFLGLKANLISKEESDRLAGGSLTAIESGRLDFAEIRENPEYLRDRSEIYKLQVLRDLEKGDIGNAIATGDSQKSRWLLDRIAVKRFVSNRSSWISSKEAVSLRAMMVKEAVSEREDENKPAGERLRKLIQTHTEKYDLRKTEKIEAFKKGENRISVTKLDRLLSKNKKSTILSYTFTPQDLKLFVLAYGKAPKVFSISLDEVQAAEQVRNFRKSLKSFRPQFKNYSRDLYQLLIKPAEAEITDSKHLIVIPEASLWELPFQALIDEHGKYFIERRSLSYAPSLKVLQTLTDKPRSAESFRDRRLVAFGHPNNREVSSLPETETEIRNLTSYFKKPIVFLKEKAKESALKRSISGAQVLHLASHGKLDSENPMRSAVYLTPGAKEDGRFEVSEIIGQKLNADLVVLSACDTSNGQVVNGEGMMSLSWAFLAAGSRSVLATQWSVDSKSAARDIVLFYEQMLAGKNKAEAIQAVMKKQISARPPFNHPSYWAGYVSIGDFR